MKALREGLADRASAAFRELLERKHLYQSVHTPFDGSFAFDSASEAPKERAASALVEGEALWKGRWSVSGYQSVDYSGRGLPAGATVAEMLRVKAPDVKLYCNGAECRRVEPFNAADCRDVFGDRARGGPVRQMFVFMYVCQSCKGEPTVFLVRRQDAKFTLVGRSPIEHVEVPAVIPRRLQSIYSDAVVAHQSSQTLAGNFMLRTLVEQWVRSFPPAAAMRAEEALNWYYSHLPKDFTQRFPSLREIYGTLSDDIHAAAGQESVFTGAVAQLIKHFDAWRLFELDHDTFGSSTGAPGQGSDAVESGTH